MYEAGQTINEEPFKGFIVREVKKGWYSCYHPSNVNDSCSLDEATTSLRWSWVHREEQGI